MTNGSACNDVRARDRYTHFASSRQVSWNTAISNIVFPESGQLRSRKVVSRSRARPTGKYGVMRQLVVDGGQEFYSKSLVS